MARPRAAHARRSTTATGAEGSEARGADISELAAAAWAAACSLAAIAMRVGPLRTKTDDEKIVSLYAMGFHRNQIAGILGTTPGTVSVRLSEAGATRRSRR